MPNINKTDKSDKAHPTASPLWSTVFDMPLDELERPPARTPDRPLTALLLLDALLVPLSALVDAPGDQHEKR